MAFKLIALSGTTGVAENIYLYETDTTLMIVDCGVGFPESDMYGVDLVIPDFSYIKEHEEKLKGIIITHGHEDHIGALPYLMHEIAPVPIYCTKLVAGFINDKFEEDGINNVPVTVFNPDTDEKINIGDFGIMPFRISHSVPDAVGFAIDTPEGRVFHVADFKFDWTPVDGRPFDVGKVARLSQTGTLVLASDCLGSTNPGYTESEATIEEKIHAIAQIAKKQVFFTTISSNISRIQQALNVALSTNRKVAFVGRSIDRKANIARELGYLKYPKALVVRAQQLKKLPPNERMYIVSGSYGQPGSALYRMALSEHEQLTMAEQDVVVFSSDPGPPGSKDRINFVVDRLIEMSVIVHYYDMQEDLHVSGHGCIKDIEMLFALVKPKYYIPIGGTIRQMHAAKQIAQNMGIVGEHVFELGEGGIADFTGGKGKKNGKVHVKKILVDGLGIGDVGNVVLRDRQVLASDGIAIVLMKYDHASQKLIDTPDIVSRGFVYQSKMRNLLDEASHRLKKEIDRKPVIASHVAKTIAVDFLERFFFVETGRRPMILPVIVEV
jgi:ribonuclease J